jgi:colanic acid/amylovoran biosynthesis glycosyltransferase
MTAQLRVVFCTHDSPASIGGPFTWLRRLLPSLRECGIDCRVLALTHFGGTGPLVEGLRADGFDVRAVDCHERTVDDVRWILTQLQDDLPQVFVPNFVVAAYYAARWVKAAGAATVGVLHSDDLFYRAIQHEFLLGEKEYRLTDVVSVSEKLHEEVSLAVQLNCRCTYIPMGAAVPPAILRDTSRRLRIAYAGRLAEEQKRISLVVRSLDLACRNVAGVEAVIYGDGPDRANVEKYLQVDCPDSRVVLAGAIASDRVQAELLQCDAIVLMSDYEGLPIALLEGMACGCIPICRTMNSGIPQLVQHGQTGLLVSDRPEDVVAAVRWLRENPRQASMLSDNARNLIQQQYSHQHSVECWNRLLRRCAGQQPGRLAIPRRIHLPPVNTHLESADRRRPPEPAWRRGLRRLRIQLGAWRRRLLNPGSHNET